MDFVSLEPANFLLELSILILNLSAPCCLIFNLADGLFELLLQAAGLGLEMLNLRGECVEVARAVGGVKLALQLADCVFF